MAKNNISSNTNNNFGVISQRRMYESVKNVCYQCFRNVTRFFLKTEKVLRLLSSGRTACNPNVGLYITSESVQIDIGNQTNKNNIKILLKN